MPLSTPIFYFDLGSPYAYLTAERMNSVMQRPLQWQPVLLGALFKHSKRSSWAGSDQRQEGIAEVESRAARYGLLPLKWPQPWPTNTLKAMRAATYASQIGKGQAFALAAFRQAFAAGKDLAELDNILIAGAACEISPRALIKAIETDVVKSALRKATDEAAARGVTGVPTVAIGEQLFWGDDQLEQAADLESGPSSG